MAAPVRAGSGGTVAPALAAARRRQFLGRQALLVGGVTVMALVSLYGSLFLGGAARSIPLVFSGPPYVSPLIIGAVVLFFGAALFTVFHRRETTWPVFAFVVGLWIFFILFEGSFIQYFVLQMGANIGFLRVRPIPIIAALAAIGLTILLHVNQLGERLVELLDERGVDEAERDHLVTRVHLLARGTVTMIWLALSGLTLVLFVGDLVLGRSRLGLRGLGIMTGLVLVIVLAVMLFRLLSAGGPVASASAAASRGGHRSTDAVGDTSTDGVASAAPSQGVGGGDGRRSRKTGPRRPPGHR